MTPAEMTKALTTIDTTAAMARQAYGRANDPRMMLQYLLKIQGLLPACVDATAQAARQEVDSDARKLAAFSFNVQRLQKVAEYAQSACVALSKITDRIVQESGQPALSTKRYAGIENIRLVARGLERRAVAAIAAAKPHTLDSPGTGENDGLER